MRKDARGRQVMNALEAANAYLNMHERSDRSMKSVMLARLITECFHVGVNQALDHAAKLVDESANPTSPSRTTMLELKHKILAAKVATKGPNLYNPAHEKGAEDDDTFRSIHL